MNIESRIPNSGHPAMRRCRLRSASAVRWVVVSVWMAVLGASAGPNPPIEFLPAESKWVLHLDLAAARATGFHRDLLPLLASLPAPALGSHLQAVLSSDLARDVTAVTACGSGGPQQGGVAYLRGRWSADGVRSMAAGKSPPNAARVGRYTVVRWIDPRDPAGATRLYACMVSTDLALLADRERALLHSLDVLDGRETPLASASRLGRLSQQARNRYWARLAAVDGGSLASMDRTGGILGQVDTLWAGIGSTASGARIDATLKTLTPEAAAQVQQMLAGSQGVLMLKGLRDPDLALLAQAMVIQCEGRTVSASLALPADVAKRLLTRHPIR